MEKPIVAIIGRPNVGKSTLFNKIVGKKMALVKDLPGVTRDRNYADCEWNNNAFTLIDTGGFEPESKDDIMAQIREQAMLAVEEAYVIVFLVDGKEGLTQADKDVAKILRKAGRLFLSAVNKIDDPKHSDRIDEFYSVGKELISISAEHSIGIDYLLDKIVSVIPAVTPVEYPEDYIRVAVVGRPNAGKSSLINKILNEERMLVSEVAGTTRDSIDSLVEIDDKKYIFVDTAGIRKKRKVSQQLEKYSIIMSIRSIEKCHIALIILDAEEGVSAQDVKIAGYAHEAGKGSIIVINKWDLITEKETNTEKYYIEAVRRKLKYLAYAPAKTISALSGQRITKLFPVIDSIAEEQSKTISTTSLNKTLENAVRRRPPSNHKGHAIRLYYATQVKNTPPTFMLFVNYAEGIHFSYTRFLQNQLRKEYGFEGTPIVIVYKNRKK